MFKSESSALYLRALPGVDEAVDHAEVVERGAEGGALTPAGAGRERAIIGRSLAAAIAGAVTQLQGVWCGFRDGAGGKRAAGRQLGPLDPREVVASRESSLGAPTAADT